MNLSFENQLAADLSALAKSQQETGRAAFDDDEHCARSEPRSNECLSTVTTFVRTTVC